MFRITKNQHNILQGVAAPEQRISAEEKEAMTDWIVDNAKRYWFCEGGPLRPPSEGGADVVIVCSLSSRCSIYATPYANLFTRSTILKCPASFL